MSEEIDNIEEPAEAVDVESVEKEVESGEDISGEENMHKYVRLTAEQGGRKKLTGMYKEWFLDYASYVILERAVPHVADGLKPVPILSVLPCSIIRTATVLSEMHWYSWDRKTF